MLKHTYIHAFADGFGQDTADNHAYMDTSKAISSLCISAIYQKGHGTYIIYVYMCVDALLLDASKAISNLCISTIYQKLHGTYTITVISMYICVLMPSFQTRVNRSPEFQVSVKKIMDWMPNVQHNKYIWSYVFLTCMYTRMSSWTTVFCRLSVRLHWSSTGRWGECILQTYFHVVCVCVYIYIYTLRIYICMDT